MINTQILEHIIKLCICSVSIKKEKPVSLILVAPVEHGKSEILKKFAFIEKVKMLTDFNTYLFSDFVNEYLSNKKSTIIIPDFLRIIKKKYSTQANSLTIMNAITEEGWVGKLPNGQTPDKPIIANIITALTQTEMRDKRHKWTQMGFLSRFIPLSFSYKQETMTLIREYIKDRKYQADEPYDFIIPDEQIDIILSKDMANKIEKISLGIALDNNITGFRLQRQLQILAMTNALTRKDNNVNDKDLEMIKIISGFINFDFTKI